VTNLLDAKNLALTGIRFSNLPARTESLNRLYKKKTGKKGNSYDLIIFYLGMQNVGENLVSTSAAFCTHTKRKLNDNPSVFHQRLHFSFTLCGPHSTNWQPADFTSLPESKQLLADISICATVP
jgi:hypothetical protein